MAGRGAVPSVGDRPRREPLTRERIVAAGVGLADSDGIDAISMRRVGAALGVEAMSLYRYVSGKDDLVDAMVDAVVTEFPAPDPGLDWRGRLRSIALGAYLVLLDHPWVAGPATSRPASGPARRAFLGALDDALRWGGCEPRLARDCAHAIDNHVFAFSLQERRHAARDDAERDAEFIFVLDLLIAGIEAAIANRTAPTAG